jgi:hypothetical protein
LQGEAPGVVDAHVLSAKQIVAAAGIEEIDVLHARADIRLVLTARIEVVICGERRREDPGVGDLMQAGDGPLAFDIVLGKTAEQLERQILVEKVGQCL